MASVYTQDDLATVKGAIIALAGGQRTVTVSYAAGGGQPTRNITYAQSQLTELRELMSEIIRDLNGTPNYRRTRFNKGFDPDNNGSGISG